jgi:hypothetical protein
MLQTVMFGMIARTLMKDAHGDLVRQVRFEMGKSLSFDKAR